MKKIFTVFIGILLLLCAFGLFSCGESGEGEKHVHNYTPIETTHPSCTEKGEVTYFCTCGDSYKKEISPLNHDYTMVITAPTCTAQGYTTYTCSRCMDSYVGDYVGVLGHNYGEWVEVIAPTCVEQGEERRVCSRDETHFETRKINKLNHNYVPTIKAPTCTERGYTTYTCTRCGDSYVGEYKNALNHNYEWRTTKEPTETQKGEKVGVCTRCGEEITRDIPELNHEHNYSIVTVVPPTCTESGYALHECPCGDNYIDEETVAIGHDYGEWIETKVPTCTEKGEETRYCSHDNNHKETRDKDALGHTPLEAVEENRIEPTCTENGSYDLVVYCAVCSVELLREKKSIESLGHNYVAVVTAPTCTAQGYTTYTCSRCGDSYTGNNTNALGHDYTHQIIEPTCTEQGYKAYTCSRCGEGYFADYVVALGHNYQNVDSESLSEFIATDEKDEFTLLFTCSNCGEGIYLSPTKLVGHTKKGYVTSETVKYEFYFTDGETLMYSYDLGVVDRFITYSDFGAVGNGVSDDFDEIRSAHAYANTNGLSVRANDGATYYIGVGDSAIIKTNTDFRNVRFIIDDAVVGVSARSKQVFTVSSDRSSYTVSLPANYSLSRGQKSVNLSFATPVLLCVENSEKKDYIRYGLNENSGNTRQEIIIVDKNGKVDSLTPIIFDYEKVTRMTAYPIDDSPITVKGGVFITIANIIPTDATYYNRGIEVRRSNTTLSGIKHYIENEGETSCPYNGFYSVSYSNDVVIKDCVMTGHKTYKYQSTNGEVSIGSYDTHSTRANAVTWLNCTQSNHITDTTYWGVMASGYCKNLTMKGCYLSRFDAHQGLYNASLINCTLGLYISVVGEGTLYIENVRRLSGSYFLQLRNDYGSTWNGDIIIKNSTMETTSYYYYLITATWTDWDFGYDCYLPNVTVDNVTVTGAGKKYVFAIVTNETLETVNNSKNPMTMPEEVTVTNSGSYYLSRNTSGLFDGVTYVNN